ncbi:DUF6351 family protein [Flavisphingomonas formosensis]|uniref:DUF6351 family protein n=1 Tax=Flavisphingomonas formosensis TaxID=861534 RepID=UPI0012FAF581|nr:DUF6351 family protein [Sphingomonas formosensis]
MILLCSVIAASSASAADAGSALRVVSSRPDMVSGTTALIQADLAAAAPANIVIYVNSKRSSAKLIRDSEGKLLFLLSKLRPGRNRVELRRGREIIAHENLRAYPLAGPIFSGPRQEPWLCQTDAFTLPDGTMMPKARNADCAVPSVVSFMYLSQAGGFRPLVDPIGRPADMARTTTKEGKLVDFIIRVETGTVDRGIYQYAVLFDPRQDADGSPFKPPSAWNRSLVYGFGGSCGPGYHQGTSMVPVLHAPTLAKGYAVASSTLNVWGNICNSVVSAEALTMVKAKIITTIGAIRHTIGIGISGGAKAQFQIADNYPGLLDGILPGIQAEGPDGVTSTAATVDCSLLVHYFNETARLSWTYDQKTAVAGWAGWNVCEATAPAPRSVPAAAVARDVARPPRLSLSWHGMFSPYYVTASAHQPANAVGCDASIPAGQIYGRLRNPHGVRCDVYSSQRNIWGERPDRPGTPRRPLDNVGLQYGLLAFQSGRISADQFIELNASIGGYDDDGNIVAERTSADDAALAIAYGSGQVTMGSGGLQAIPIIDLRMYTETNPDLHNRLGSFVTRARLRAHGDLSNFVIYTFPASAMESVNGQALDDMQAWLNRIDADRSDIARSVKIRRNRGALTDTCWDSDGVPFAEPADPTASNRCNGLYPVHANPRIAAGMPTRLDVLKCAMKPIDPAEYRQPLTDAQLSRLRAIFPSGICDFSKPGIGSRPLAGVWLNYAVPGAPVASGSNGDVR